MDYKAVFNRVEMKYVLDKQQMKGIMDAAGDRLTEDEYAESTIRSIYFDTEDFVMARRSIDKPVYKEKLRLRSYSPAKESDTVFMEIKKKYDGVVYKRRTGVAYSEALEWMEGQRRMRPSTQIECEIDYLSRRYGHLVPQMLITYDRLAMKGSSDDSFRITFDSNVKARTDDVDLGSDIGGMDLIREGNVLMEVKSNGGIPFWMTDFLCENRIYPTSFSKYGSAYRNIIICDSAVSE